MLLEFRFAETEQKIPDFKDGGVYFFTHILESVSHNFDNKFYEDEARDAYNLVEMIGWNGERAILKAKTKKSLPNIFLGFVMSNANLFWKGIWSAKT